MSALALLCAAALFVQEPVPDKRRLTSAPDRRVELDFQHYYKTRELRLALSSLAAAYPEFVRLDSLGKSRSGEDIWLVTLSEAGGADPRTKPGLLISASQSLSDVQGSELALSSMVEFLQNHAREERVGRALRETTLYFVPCVHPDLRGSVLTALESGSGPAPESLTRVELERNYPVGWSPFASLAGELSRDPGPYPLSEPEARWMSSFLVEHENVGVLVGFAPAGSSQGPGALHDAAPREQQIVKALIDGQSAFGGATLEFFGRAGEPRGSFDDFAYGQLGALPLRVLCGELDPQSGLALPRTDEIAPLAHGVALSLLSLAEALPRVTIAGTSVQRLRNDLWQIEVTISNTGSLRTQTVLGSVRRAVPRPRLLVTGGKIAGAGVRSSGAENFTPASIDEGRFDLDELDGGAQLRARILVTAPAETNVELTVVAPRAGRASASLVLR